MIENDRRWFGGLPPDWSDAPIDYHFDVVLGKMINAKNEVNGGVSAPYLAAGSIQPDHLLLDDTKRMDFSMSELRRYSLKRDDIVVVEGGAGYGRSHLLKDDLVGWGFQNHVARVRQRSGAVLPEFLVYVLKACLASGFIEANNRTATLPSLSSDVLGAIIAPMPSPDEQHAIADYLDQETAQIDALVAKQEELIGLLRERRRATITTAVTKGVNFEPVLTDSGVSSLGSIPAHWSVKKVKHLGRAMIGLTYTPEQLVGPDGGGTLVLRANNIQNGCIDLTDTVYVDGPVPNDLRVRSGDILICARNGSARLIGKNAILEPSLAGQTWGAFMAVLRSPFNRYLRWVLNSQVFAANIGLYMTTTVNQLTNATLHNLEVAVPPALEQQQIAAYLDDETSRIDTLIAKAEEHIALAKERRAALITAAVTGQFDVRSARKAG